MGEAYALWYHMRRVAQLYELFERCPGAFKPLEWADRTWRMLDVGAGTGAGAMAVAQWLRDDMEARFPGTLERASVTCLEPARPMLETGDRIAAVLAERFPRGVKQDWRMGALEEEHDLDDPYDVILFSTTFDYVEAVREDELLDEVLRFVDRHLAPGGSVLALAPNAGYDGVNAGPKIRFARRIFAALGENGFREYRKEDPAEPPAAVQALIQRERCRLYDEAASLSPPVQLYPRHPESFSEASQPQYRRDAFSYGRWLPRR
jgi:SAM-dependent methyltransferase